MAEIYQNAIKKAETFSEDSGNWKEAFQSICQMPLAEQADVFLLRFTLQLSKQEVESKDFVRQVTAMKDMFTEKTKSTDGKKLQYGGVEFGDIYNEFCGENITFIERKKRFQAYDLDNNGHIDIIEFLLYYYRDKIIQGFKERNDVQDIENEAEALMEELVTYPMFIDPKLDAAVLGLKKLKATYDAEVEKAKQEAQEGGGVKKIQLPETLKKLDKKYEDDQKAFLSIDAIGKKKKKIQKQQQEIVEDIRKTIEAEDEQARGPTKK